MVRSSMLVDTLSHTRLSCQRWQFPQAETLQEGERDVRRA